jgi:signal transduction histidine kinase/NADH:ubiquinone oxidoreductase subunit K
MLTTIILTFSAVVLLLLAATVVVSNYRASANRWLGIFIFSGLIWLLANLFANLSLHNPDLNLLFSRSALIGSSLVPFTFVMFCIRFTGSSIRPWQRTLLFAPILLLLASVPTKLNVASVSKSGSSIDPGPAYVLLLAVMAVYFTIGIRLLLRSYRKSTDVKRKQLYYILLGTMLTVVPGVLLNGVAPQFGNSDVASYGPIAVLFFSALTTTAIIRHRLFDIRMVIARALGYAGSLTVLAMLYGFIIFGIGRVFFEFRISLGFQIYVTIAIGLAGLSFQYLKRNFDKVTQHVFYQDAYEPQELFAQLNKVLVSSLDVKDLMMRSISVIETALKPDFAVIGLRDGSASQRIFASKQVHFSNTDIRTLRSITPHVYRKVIIVDDIDPAKHSELKSLLRKNEIAALVRLTQKVRSGEEGYGYLVLGSKKSGNPYTQQDIRVLDTVADELIIAIQNALHYEEIQQFNVVLQARVDDATRKLRRTNEKLKALDETKDDFISMASHQLRTPLTSVKGYLSMVLEGDAGKINATQRKMLGQAFVSSQRMVYLIADLLNVSRLKTGKFLIEAAPTNLAQMVSEEIDQLVETAAARDISLSYDQPPSFPDLMLDETKTRQVIMNFVDNAIYYTPAKGHIKVELSDNPTSVELKVVDDGIGVPKAEQHHLFTKFYRAGNARKARPDGTGLGLYMAKKVILAQGGSIIFESHEGKGSTFGFLFPKDHVKRVAKLPVAEAQETVPSP